MEASRELRYVVAVGHLRLDRGLQRRDRLARPGVEPHRESIAAVGENPKAVQSQREGSKSGHPAGQYRDGSLELASGLEGIDQRDVGIQRWP